MMTLGEWANLGQAVEGAAAVVGLVGGSLVALRELRKHREFLMIERRLDAMADLWLAAYEVAGLVETFEQSPITSDPALFGGDVVAKQEPLRIAVDALYRETGRTKLVLSAEVYRSLFVLLETLHDVAAPLQAVMRNLPFPRSGSPPTKVVDAETVSKVRHLRQQIFSSLQSLVGPHDRAIGSRVVDWVQKLAEP